MSAETHICLFVFEGGVVSRYKITQKKGGELFFDPRLYGNDEKSRVFSERFWEEWERDFGYAEGDSLDYAFISDETNVTLEVPSTYPVCAPTQFFNYARIRTFMESNLPYKNLSLSYLGNTERIKNIASNNEKRFFLTIPQPSEHIQAHSFSKDSAPIGAPLGAYCYEERQRWSENSK
jgi:hypothetical protein